MGEAIAWFITLELLGLAAVPLAATFLRGLPDRGFGVAKVLGLLVTVWLAYILAMLQMASFGRGLLLMCALVLIGVSAWLLWRQGGALINDFRARLRDRGFVRYLIVAESLYTAMFIFWVVMRAFSPDIFGTEKFMDFGFMNAIVKSATFPPNDPWLAGQPINYYYFGYVMMASLSLLSGVPTEYGFNLANASLAALTALGSFSFVFNALVAGKARQATARVAEAAYARPDRVPQRRQKAAAAAAVGARGAQVPVRRSQQVAAGAGVASRSRDRQKDGPAAADMPARQQEQAPTGDATASTGGKPPAEADGRRQAMPEQGTYAHASPPYEAAPQDDAVPHGFRATSPYVFGVLAALMVVTMGHLSTLFAVKQPELAAQGGNGWRFCFMCQKPESFDWWGPSRVIRDYRVVQEPGQAPQKQVDPIEAINEFPAFSFYLADLHPLVMALPLWTLALSAALAVARRRVVRGSRWRDGLPHGPDAWLGLTLLAITIGALYTTNTWDYPTFLLLALAALTLPYLSFQRAGAPTGGWRWLRPWLVQAALLVVLSLVVFLPFHLTFKSLVGSQPATLPESWANIPLLGWVLQKLGGLLLINTWDKGITGFLMIFGIFLVGILGWLVYELVDYTKRRSGVDPVWYDLVWIGAGAALALVLAALLRFPLLALLLPMAAVAVYLIWAEPQRIERNMVLAVVATAALIGLVIEVVFLRDVFNSRQNTIFKFYYQIWMLWALASAYGVWRVLDAAFSPVQAQAQAAGRAGARARTAPVAGNLWFRSVAAVWAVVFGLLVLSGLMYTGYTFAGRLARNEQLHGLDGMAYLARSAPGDYQAILWLRANATGSEVVLECCRDEYNNPGLAGRVSAYSGIPTLISWDGHEVQWRGGQPDLLNDLGRRRNVVTSIYQGVDPDNPGQPLTAQRLLQVLHDNHINYVFVGAVERGEGVATGAHPEERVTPQAENLFRQVLVPAFTSGSTVVYRVPLATGSQRP